MEKQIYIKPNTQEVEFQAKLMNLSLIDEIKEIPWLTIKKQDDEDLVVSKAVDSGKVVVSFENDAIIPLENLIAKLNNRAEIFVHVTSLEEAKTALDTLEIGANGVVLETSSPDDVSNAVKILEFKQRFELKEAVVTTIKPSNIGYRVCIDTADLMAEGEGILVGTSSSGLILVEAEVKKNDFVATRPFRVNAGAVSLYTLLPNGKTQYLSELSAGDEVLITNRDGVSRSAVIARCKLEKRPLILVEAKVKDIIVKGVYQNAETIRFVQREGSVEVTNLKVGDKILVKIEKGGRHFGMKIEEETIIEK